MVITGDTEFTYTYKEKEKISYTVTFKVVNGGWDDKTGEEATKDITVTLDGHEGDTLKLSAGDIPAVGHNPDPDYEEGDWGQNTPTGDMVITGDTEFTYTYAPIPAPTVYYTVTFKVVNGSWNDSTSTDKTVQVEANNTLSAGDIPAVGSQPDAGYRAGSWDVTPDTTTPITGDTTYTYTYVEKEKITVTITGNTDTKEYNGEEQNVTGYTVDIPEGADFTEDDIKFTGTDEAKGTNVGTYDMGLKEDDFSVESERFTVTFSVTDGSLEITPKKVTVTADDKTKKEGKKDPKLTYEVDGLIGDDKIEVSISREEGEDPGKYAIIPTGEEKQGNYEVEYVNGTLTIEKDEPTPTPTPTPDPDDDDDDDDDDNPGGGNNPGVNPPAGPAAPAPAPAAPQVIDDPETPLDPGEEIEEPETPLAPAEPARPVWALINLLCTIASVLLSLLVLLFYLGKSKKEEDKENEDGTTDTEEKDVKKKGLLRVLDIIPAVVAVIAFILTEDMSNDMVLVDQWTLMMVVILLVDVVAAIFTKKKVKDDDEDEQEENAQA